MFIELLLFLSLTFPKTSGVSVPSQELSLITVPFKYDPMTFPVPGIYVSINGSNPLLVLVDTGTSHPLLLDKWAAKQLNLLPTKATGSEGDVDSETNVGPAKILIRPDNIARPVQFTLDTIVEEDLSGIRQLFGPRKIAGIIGIAMFEQGAIAFDFKARRLEWDLKALDNDDTAEAVLPLRESEGEYFLPVVWKNKQTLYFKLDTGSDITTLHTTVASKLGLHTYRKGQLQRIDSQHESGIAKMSPIWLGSTKIIDTDVYLVPETSSSVIGLDLLSQFRFRVNFVKRTFTYDKRSEIKYRPYGTSGLDVVQQNGKFIISHTDLKFRKTTPRPRVGDEILSINGNSVRTFSTQLVQRMMDGFAGDVINVVLRRPNGTIVRLQTRASNGQPGLNLPNKQAPR